MAATDPVWSNPQAIAVLGTGVALPGPGIETDDLLRLIDVRFGLQVAAKGAHLAAKLKVKTRHLVREFETRRETPRPGDSNPDLAARAVSTALKEAGLKVADLAYLIGHTATPALPIPSNIALAADILGYEGPHMELRQACTGFANALVIAQGLLANPGCGPVAIVGSETGSVHFDPNSVTDDIGQLVNLVMMGDGAGAVVLARADDPRAQASGATLSNVFLGQIGKGRAPGLSRKVGGSAQPWSDDHVLAFDHDFAHVRESGPELFLRGAAASSALGVEAMASDVVIPHQASGRIGEQFERYFGLPKAQVFVNADKVGNTGSAAIWLALGQLRPTLSGGERVSVLGAEATKHLFGGFTYVHG